MRYILIIFITIFSLQYSNAEEYTVNVIDFSVRINDQIIKVDGNFDEALNLLTENYGNSDKTIDHGWNIIGHQFNGIEITYVKMPDHFEMDKLIYSIILTDPLLKTHRGASVYDKIRDIRILYELDFKEYHYIFEKDSSYIIQKTFYRKESDDAEEVATYEGESNKTLSMTFIYDDKGIVTKIIMNKAYEM